MGVVEVFHRKVGIEAPEAPVAEESEPEPEAEAEKDTE